MISNKLNENYSNIIIVSFYLVSSLVLNDPIRFERENKGNYNSGRILYMTQQNIEFNSLMIIFMRFKHVPQYQ